MNCLSDEKCVLIHTQFRFLERLNAPNREMTGFSKIGVYFKKFLYRNKEVRVEFKYRSKVAQKTAQVVRLPVLSVEEADKAIQQWLQSRHKNPPVAVAKVTTLFMRPLDRSVYQPSYHAFHNSKRTRGPNAGGVVAQTTTISKLKRARYAQQKRNERVNQQRHHDEMVISCCAHLMYTG